MSDVALDTMTLIYALRETPLPQKDELRQRARILIRQLTDDKATVIVPTVVVAELLVPIAPEKHGGFIHELRQRFVCPPLDLQAAAFAASLWREHRKLSPKEQIKRTTLKADVLIVATAYLAGARVFYSHDAKCRRLATLAKMEGRDLPTHHENMFVDKEIRADDT